MVASLPAVAFLRYASYQPAAPPNNSEWDLLYVAATLAAFILIVVAAATLANARDDRRR